MKITRDNYEQYMIDFLDNNLSKEHKSQMTRFLDANPDIREEAEGLFTIEKADDSVCFPDKDMLKSIAMPEDEYEISHEDYLAIADMEGDLTDDEKAEVQSIGSAEEAFAVIKDALRKTKLVPDTTIYYPEKNELKHIAAETEIEDRAEYLAIALAEGDISESEKAEWEALTNENPELTELPEQYAALKLQADTTEVFNAKDDLKQNPFLVNKFTYAPVAVAASIVAVFFILGNLLTPQEPVNVQGLADISFSDQIRQHKETETQEEAPDNTYVHPVQYAQNTSTPDNGNEGTDEQIADTDSNYQPVDLPKTDVRVELRHTELFAMTQREDIVIPDDLPINDYQYETDKTHNENINPAWMLAEKGVDVWKTITSSDVMMANSYNEDGDIERFQLKGKRLGISRTFHRK